MSCYLCQQEAVGTCTRCGREFCEEHGGGRLAMPQNKLALFPSIRAVCDRCTPNQLWMTLQPYVAFAVFLGLIMGLVYLLSWRFKS
jgi:hypothetical protein